MMFSTTTSPRPVSWQLALNPIIIAFWACDFVIGVLLWLASLFIGNNNVSFYALL